LGGRLILVGLAVSAAGELVEGADRGRQPSSGDSAYFSRAEGAAEPVPVRSVEARPALAVEARPISASRRMGGEEPIEMPCEELVSCEIPWWAHRSGVWGELLYIRPGSTDIVYAIEQNDVVDNAFPTGPVGDVAIQGAMGFRVGFGVCLSECSSLVASYSYWSGDDSQQITRMGDNVLLSEIIHPSTITSGSQSLQANAAYDISFNTADLAHRSLIVGDDTFALNWSAGLRYGNLQQQFQHQQTISTATGLVTVDSKIDFDGFGLMFGVDGMTYSYRTGFYSYGKAMISMLAGEWKGAFRQQNQFPGGIVANNYEDFRITPQGELEVGLGWQNCSGNLRLSVGYLATGWFDSVTTRSYVDAVHAGNYTNVGETLTFSGLVTRVEFAF